jgi:secreted trypsin-like serine protease
MKFIIFSILIAFAFAQEEFDDFDPFITSPTQALVGEFPSAVIIRSPGNPVNTLCGGTIIDRQHILTSAQCMLNAQNQIINPFWYTIDAGDVNILRATSRRETRRVIRVFVHPQYNPVQRNQ